MAEVRVGLIGDHNHAVKAHRAIPQAIYLAGQAAGVVVESEWIHTELLERFGGDSLSEYSALWCVPASPYASMNGALMGIQYAREHRVPFLGTCGGFQHSLIEIARNKLHIQDADHAETNPDASALFVTPLTCALREVEGNILLEEGSRIRTIYGADEVTEEFNCGFGLNPLYKERLKEAGVRITGVDAQGDARVIELADHPFFLATLYQPERSALKGRSHPIVEAYLQASASKQRQGQIAVEVGQ